LITSAYICIYIYFFYNFQCLIFMIIIMIKFVIGTKKID
jgi:hypothetical protein